MYINVILIYYCSSIAFSDRLINSHSFLTKSMIIDGISIDCERFLIKLMIIDDSLIDYRRFLIKSMIINDISIDYNRFRLKIIFNRLFCSFLIEFNRLLAI